MQSMMALWGLLLLISTFVVPQLLGVLLHFRLLRFSKWLAFIFGALTPPVLFFFLAPHFFFAGLREAASQRDVVCGMPVFAATVMVLLGIGAQVLIALMVQVCLFRKLRNLRAS